MNIVEPSPANIRSAAQALLDGKLIVIPTETVYGLAADATNRAAVQSIFEAKGRPADNPLIVHIADQSWLDELAADILPYARKLAEAFWPGPMTLVLTKLPHVLDEVTAGLDTVAVRMPNHDVAIQILKMAGVPIAAPSANKFMQLSPTRAEHIDEEVGNLVEMIVDGGPCDIGLESTVLDCSQDRPRLLRPGGISRQRIEHLLGYALDEADENVRRSPGQYPRHYAPKTPVRLVHALRDIDAGITFRAPRNANQIQFASNDPVGYAMHLYNALHVLDDSEVPEILIESPPDTPEWEAVWDRLRKASSR